MDWKKSFWINVSFDEESKKAKESIKVKVVCDFNKLTDAERLDWLTNGQSPRVYIQGQLRRLDKKEFDKLNGTEYTVVFKPVGTKAEVDIEGAFMRQWASWTPERRAEYLKKLSEER